LLAVSTPWTIALFTDFVTSGAGREGRVEHGGTSMERGLSGVRCGPTVVTLTEPSSWSRPEATTAEEEKVVEKNRVRWWSMVGVRRLVVLVAASAGLLALLAAPAQAGTEMQHCEPVLQH